MTEALLVEWSEQELGEIRHAARHVEEARTSGDCIAIPSQEPSPNTHLFFFLKLSEIKESTGESEQNNDLI